MEPVLGLVLSLFFAAAGDNDTIPIRAGYWASSPQLCRYLSDAPEDQAWRETLNNAESDMLFGLWLSGSGGLRIVGDRVDIGYDTCRVENRDGDAWHLSCDGTYVRYTRAIDVKATGDGITVDGRPHQFCPQHVMRVPSPPAADSGSSLIED